MGFHSIDVSLLLTSPASDVTPRACLRSSPYLALSQWLLFTVLAPPVLSLGTRLLVHCPSQPTCGVDVEMVRVVSRPADEDGGTPVSQSSHSTPRDSE